MAAIPDDYGTGGAGLDPTGTDSQPALALCLRDVADDLAHLRAAIVGITAKLDADGGVTDVNYAATWDPAALATTKA